MKVAIGVDTTNAVVITDTDGVDARKARTTRENRTEASLMVSDWFGLRHTPIEAAKIDSGYDRVLSILEALIMSRLLSSTCLSLPSFSTLREHIIVRNGSAHRRLRTKFGLHLSSASRRSLAHTAARRTIRLRR